MSAYVRYYRRLQALTQRLSTYLDRLEARAREFGVSSARTAMEMQITDPASVSAFRSEVEAQIMFLHTKAQRVFAKHFAPFLDIDADLSIDEDRQLSARLQDAALAGDNLFEVLMDAVRTCSLGDITHTLFEVGGRYRRNV